ncbi:MAG: FAD-binding oxidoreductase [Roseiflexaceae bacterium]
MYTIDDQLEQQIAHLQQRMHGEILFPGSNGYDQARRIWNGRIDRHPAVIMRCRCAADVALALATAQTYHLPISVCGGGHQTAGLAVAEAGMLIDLRPMTTLTIDPRAHTARAGAGLMIGGLVEGLGASGLATTTGTCAGTGIAGSTLGGGIGWLAGRYGLGIDNLLAAEIVTPDGMIRQVHACEQSDLFWAIRGGGGNFGIVTTFEYRVHPLNDVVGGMLVYRLADAAAVLTTVQQCWQQEHDAFGMLVVLATFPTIGPVVMIQGCSSDSDQRTNQLLHPLRQAAPVVLDTFQRMPYAQFFAAHSPPVPDGLHYYDTAVPFDAFTPTVIEQIVRAAERFSSPMSSIVIHRLHGAATRVDPQATAFALREPHAIAVFAAGWEPGSADAHLNWANSAAAALQPAARLGLYTNFMGQGSPEAIRAAYRQNYQRLSQIKASYDPANLLRRNQNIQPAQPYGL